MVLLIEAHRGVTDGVRAILDGLEGQVPARVPVALAINKIDRVPAEKLLALSAEANGLRDFAATFMISAERGHGVDDLRSVAGGAGAGGALALSRGPDRRRGRCG